jgi:Dockerin type I domain
MSSPQTLLPFSSTGIPACAQPKTLHNPNLTSPTPAFFSYRQRLADALHMVFSQPIAVGKANNLTGVTATNARSSSYDIFADVNGNGVVDATDVRIVRSRIGTSQP